MANRPRLPIPFGGGLDRETGLLVVDKSAFADVRNWHLHQGRMALRQGLERTEAFEGSDVIAIAPLRSRSQGVVLSYDVTSGNVTLHRVTPAGVLLATVGLVAHVDPGSLPPRFLMADVYRRMFIAHDEPDLARRWPTIIYDEATDTLTGAFSGLGGTPSFRGVARHLNYLVGWGWGTPTDPDRPETVRISLPGAPLMFDLLHYFLVGQQGEPVLMCESVGAGGSLLATRKLSETYTLVGYDRATFGIQPADMSFGQMCSRLSVSVGGTSYFWSEAGPRSSNGGPSTDLALPLNLGGPSPDALAAAGDTETAFSTYDSDQREVLFVFGEWAYVLHLADQTPRWSYRQFGVPLFAAGTLYESVVSSTVAPPAALITLVANVGATSGTQTWSWSIAGGLDPADQIEWWVREVVGPFAGTWQRKFIELVAGRSAATTTVTGLYAGEFSDWAVRLTRAGVPGVVYAAADPMLWPGVARHVADPAAVTTLPVPVITATAFHGGVDTLDLTRALLDGWYTHISHEVEISDGMGGWIAAPTLIDGLFLTEVDGTPYIGLTRDIRIRRHTADGLVGPTAWVVIAAFDFADDLAPLVAALAIFDGIYLADRDLSSGPGTDFAVWNGRDGGGMPAVSIGGPGSPLAPAVNALPPRITFDGVNDVINDYLESVGAGATVLVCVRCTEAAAVRRPVFGQGVVKPSLYFDAAGKLEFNGGGVPLSAVDRRGDWIIAAYTQASGAAVGRGYDGGTPLGNDAGAASSMVHPVTLNILTNQGAHFVGDVFALVFSPVHATDLNISDAYTALKALAAAAGIAVVN